MPEKTVTLDGNSVGDNGEIYGIATELILEFIGHAPPNEEPFHGLFDVGSMPTAFFLVAKTRASM